MIKVKTNKDAFPRLRSASDALKITNGDLAGPVLVRLGQVHIKQQKRIFATEGSAGARGKWTPLEPSYAKRKFRVFGRKKILEASGETKRRFTSRSSSYYIQRFVSKGEGRGRFLFGAKSDVAAAHLYGNPALAASVGPTRARTIFGGVAPHLPVRDPITKSAGQRAELTKRLIDWYRKERVPQVLRGLKKLSRRR